MMQPQFERREPNNLPIRIGALLAHIAAWPAFGLTLVTVCNEGCSADQVIPLTLIPVGLTLMVHLLVQRIQLPNWWATPIMGLATAGLAGFILIIESLGISYIPALIALLVATIMSVGPPTQHTMFSTEGRLSRTRYWANAVMPTSALAVAAFFLGILLLHALPPIGIIFCTLAAGYLVWAITTASIKRCHDAGYSSDWLLLCLVPGAAPAGLVLLGTLPPEPGTNEYDLVLETEPDPGRASAEE